MRRRQRGTVVVDLGNGSATITVDDGRHGGTWSGVTRRGVAGAIGRDGWRLVGVRVVNGKSYHELVHVYNARGYEYNRYYNIGLSMTTGNLIAIRAEELAEILDMGSDAMMRKGGPNPEFAQAK